MYPLGSIGRYRPNKAASDAGSDVKEYLVVVTREEKSTIKQVKVPALEEAFA
jgi:adenine-specific DNA-methyltransferase